MSGIRLSNVFKRFHDTQVINQVDLEIKNGEFCVFIGHRVVANQRCCA